MQSHQVIALCLLSLCSCVCPSSADIPSTPSPCPGVLTYDATAKASDRWYADVKLVTDIALTGFSLDIVLDRKAHLLGNNMAPTVSRDNKEFTIQNLRLTVVPGEPPVARIFVKYGEGESPPAIETIRLNGRVICSAQNLMAPSLQRNIETAVNKRVYSNKSPDITNNFEDDVIFVNNGDSRTPPAAATKQLDDNACGTVAASPALLISGGIGAERGQWPWHVALFISRKGGNMVYICGGTLISKSTVVTAAHCVTRRYTRLPINPQLLVVHLGKHFLDQSLEGEQIVLVKKIIIHDEFNSTNFRADVAILKLSSEIVYTDLVRPVCLWDPRDSNTGTVLGKAGTVAGWGIDATRNLTANLTYVRMPVVQDTTCLNSNNDFFSRFISDTSYCAGFRNGSAVCNGDSGGGMVFRAPGDRPDSKMVWRIRGLVSLSVALQDEAICDPNHYVVFTDLAKFVPWLRENS